MLSRKETSLWSIISRSFIIPSKRSTYMQSNTWVKSICLQYSLLTSIYENVSKFSKDISTACFLSKELDINLSISFLTFLWLYFTIYISNHWFLYNIKCSKWSPEFSSRQYTVLQPPWCLFHIYLSYVRNISLNESNPALCKWYRTCSTRFLSESM